MPLQTPRRVSVSTWALHPLIQTCAPGRPGDPDARLMGDAPGSLDLLEVPAALAERGFKTMELCHFHIPSRDPEYLVRFKAAREAAGVELWSLLIDDGDINDSENGDRDREWILSWIDDAHALGAKCARVIGGKQHPTQQNLMRTHEQLKRLAVDGYLREIHVLTENWYPTLSTPENVHQVLDGLEGAVGLNFDFGNWGGESKYENLADIVEYAEGSHAKCDYRDGKPDVEDFTRCLQIAADADYSGPFTLVYGEPGRVWESLDEQRELVRPYL